MLPTPQHHNAVSPSALSRRAAYLSPSISNSLESSVYSLCLISLLPLRQPDNLRQSRIDLKSHLTSLNTTYRPPPLPLSSKNRKRDFNSANPDWSTHTLPVCLCQCFELCALLTGGKRRFHSSVRISHTPPPVQPTSAQRSVLPMPVTSRLRICSLAATDRPARKDSSVCNLY